RPGDDVIEGPGRVEDDIVVGLHEKGDDALDVAGMDVAPVRRPDGGRQNRDAGVVGICALLDDLARNILLWHSQVSDASFDRNVHENRDVTEARVEVDDNYGLFGLLDEGGGEVRGDRGLADASLRTKHRDDGAGGDGLVHLTRQACAAP